MRVKFISVDYLKEHTTIEDNVDSDKLVPYIYEAQDMHIQQALGTTFYNRLRQGVIDGDLNADETNLLQTYIQPCLVWWVLYYAMPTLNFKLTNKAVSQESSQYSTSSLKSDVDFLRHDVRNFAEFRTARLNKYLCDYFDLFPEYQNPGDKVNLHKSNRSYFNNLYIPKGGKSDWDKYHKTYT